MNEFMRDWLTEIAEKNEIDDDHDWGYQVRMVNESGYCGKFLVLENHDRGGYHYHEKKKETFIVLRGHVTVRVEGSEGQIVFSKTLERGEQVTIQPLERHWMKAFSTPSIVLEVSTHDDDEDTYYVQ